MYCNYKNFLFIKDASLNSTHALENLKLEDFDEIEFRPDRLAHYSEEGMLVKIIIKRLRFRAVNAKKTFAAGTVNSIL